MKRAVRPHWQEVVEERRKASKRPFRHWGWGLAAATLVLSAAGLSVWRITDRKAPVPVVVATLARTSGEVLKVGVSEADSGVAIAVGQVLRTGEGILTADSRAALRLANGVSVRLDHRTRLRLVEPGIVALDRGAVYVDSERSSPIRVETRLGAIEDIGTQFEVRLVGDRLRMRIREGRVLLNHDRGSAEGRQGEELLLQPGGSLVRSRVATWGDPWRWVLETSAAGDFDGQPLDRFLAWVGRETGLEIRFAEPRLERLARRTVEGDIGGLTVEEALAVVLPVFGLDHRIRESELIVLPLANR